MKTSKSKQKPLSFVVKEKDTLLAFLLANIKNMSRNSIKNLLSKKQISVDGKIVTKFDYPLHTGQTVALAPVKQNALQVYHGYLILSRVFFNIIFNIIRFFSAYGRKLANYRSAKYHRASQQLGHTKAFAKHER